jgi:hypothetical protein
MDKSVLGEELVTICDRLTNTQKLTIILRFNLLPVR